MSAAGLLRKVRAADASGRKFHLTHWEYMIPCITRYIALLGLKAKQGNSADLEGPDRWEAQLRKGALEMAALASLWRGRLYGLEIIRHLEGESRLNLSEGTIYPILNRLKAEGLLTSEWVEAEAGHPRKYYTLTDAGRARLLEMSKAWASFAEGLTRLLEPVLNDSTDSLRRKSKQEVQP